MDEEEALIFVDGRLLQLGNKMKGIGKLLIIAEFKQLKRNINTTVVLKGGLITKAEAEGLFMKFEEAIGL